ncbi:type VII secretion target [Saccharomonospora glauca]|uniref:PE domain-containing protein n=1 Tax=Saccharomonospora glauca K62 TaxID=928724 RepID=I1CY31_9PSEU|nr:type VII secretion target [Saccharomonospora glauca]EIE97605.1 Protein of unknown function (DUF2580) [Saccharomonospora glauca K62]
MSQSGGFGIDAHGLDARAGEFATLAERVRAVAGELADVLDATPTPWGSDAVGESFAAGHVEAAERTREQLARLAGEFEEFGTALAEAAKAYVAADTTAADEVRAVDEPDRAG